MTTTIGLALAVVVVRRETSSNQLLHSSEVKLGLGVVISKVEDTQWYSWESHRGFFPGNDTHFKPTLMDVYKGDAYATVRKYGFKSTKLDGCGWFNDLRANDVARC